MPWHWNEKAGRYQDDETGRFLSRAHLEELLADSIRHSADTSGQLSDWVSNGQIRPAAWAEIFKQELKEEYIRQYLAGIGGRSMMTSKDWGKLGQMLKEQYKYFDKFAEQVAAGNLSQAQIDMRSSMYFNSASEAYNKANGKTAVKWGADEVQWVIGPVKTEHCQDCQERAALGWQLCGPSGGFPVDGGEAFPGDGNSQCLTDCHCGLNHRNSSNGTIFGGEPLPEYSYLYESRKPVEWVRPN